MASTPQHRFLPLDGLRGTAILLVLLLHLFNYGPLKPWLFGGWAGVDLFFVLSGFLITGILADHRHQPGSYRRFLRNRALRTLPLYYAVLIVFALVAPFASPTRWFPTYQWWFWTHTSNLLVWYHGFQLPLGHFWSLALEEQFYLFWPAIVLLLPVRGTLGFASMLLLLGIVLRSVVVHPYLSYALPFAHLDGVLVGSAIAIGMRVAPKALLAYAYGLLVASVVALAALVVLHYFGSAAGNGDRFQEAPFSLTAVAAFWGALLLSVYRSHGLQQFFSLRILRFFGKYAYGMYVFNSILLHYTNWAFAGRLPEARRLPVYALVLAATILLSVASYHLFEIHFLKRKRSMAARKIPQQ